MSDDKSSTNQFAQESQHRPQVDMLDAQYKSIGISAVSAAATAMKCHKIKKPTEQMS
jgi:hypothetical protein